MSPTTYCLISTFLQICLRCYHRQTDRQASSQCQCLSYLYMHRHHANVCICVVERVIEVVHTLVITQLVINF